MLLLNFLLISDMKSSGKVIFLPRSIFFYLFFYFLILSPEVKGQYEVNILKAAYIERITRFIEWPDHNRDTTKFRIGVYGDNKLAEILSNTLKERKIKGKPVEVKIITDPEKIHSYDLCCFENINEAQVSEIVLTANKEGTLIFTNVTNNGKNVGHINFYIEDDKLKFEINKSSITNGNFKVSYILLSNSKII